MAKRQQQNHKNVPTSVLFAGRCAIYFISWSKINIYRFIASGRLCFHWCGNPTECFVSLSNKFHITQERIPNFWIPCLSVRIFSISSSFSSSSYPTHSLIRSKFSQSFYCSSVYFFLFSSFSRVFVVR